MKYIEIKPANKSIWGELTELFGKSGAYWGCWCMFWRISNKEFNEGSSDEHKIQLKVLVEDASNYTPGLLAFIDKIPVGWLGFGPRTELVRLDKSRVIQPVDDSNILSIICFFIKKGFRKQGIAKALVNEAIAFGREAGFDCLESYPIEIKVGDNLDNTKAYMGISPLFEKLGFEFVEKTKSKSDGKARIIMRYYFN